MRARLNLILWLLLIVIGAYAVSTLIDRTRLPGIDLDRTAALTALIEDRTSPVAGPQNAVVTLVVITDYQCGICRLDHPELMEVMRERPDLRIVFKEWAILGPASQEAARVALAARYQGRYLPTRDALMRAGRLTPATMRAAVERAGVDWRQLVVDRQRNGAEIEAELVRASRQAMGLGLPGTPATLIGRRLVVGRLRGANLRQLIARAAKEP